jgi:FAD/FMN-containing dehydrogenase/uncharacterized membrane protein YhaH (DUF805 family)/SAM-dependent methyltransferase
MLRTLLSPTGRLRRSAFWGASLLLAGSFVGLFMGVQALVGRSATLALYPPVVGIAFVLAARRYHDLNRSGGWLLFLAIPILGPIAVGIDLFFRRGTRGENRYGPDPRIRPTDYAVVPDGARAGEKPVVNDITGLNPVTVAQVVAPETVEELREVIRTSQGPLSIGGGRFSMGGQTASPGTLHLDLRRLNQVIRLSPSDRTVRVQAGIRWCDLQRFLDPHDLAVKVMQSYANFTVGGSISVNAHGRYVGLGPLILSVRSILLVLADGSAVEASPKVNAELFYGAVGGYGALGVIAEAELDVVPNATIERVVQRGDLDGYLDLFRTTVRDTGKAVLHNADLYPPDFNRLRAVTWNVSKRPLTVPDRLQSPRASYPVHRYCVWSVSSTPTGKWRRENLLEPLLLRGRRVCRLNYEAGYDVGELEPRSRTRSTFVLQEYFVPIGRFREFVPRMREVLRRHRVNVLNVSVRPSVPDPGSLLAWAREEVLAFVLYYKQGTDAASRSAVPVWTRELIDAALGAGGSYYLPYQVHATPEQFHRAYPRARELFALKKRVDPDYRFRNALWDAYYAPTIEPLSSARGSEFRTVLSTPSGNDAVFRFLQNIFHLNPEDRLQALLLEGCRLHGDDEKVYRYIQEKLPTIKPFLGDFRFALPALGLQKREMARQTLELLGSRRRLNGLVEIGTTGRYVSELRKHVEIAGPITLVNDAPPTNSPVDILERGGLAQIGRFVPLRDYAPLNPADIPDASVDLVTCYIGLHHASPEQVEPFLRSVARVLRPGGLFILRDHDVQDPAMNHLVCLAHTIFNAGTHVSWETNRDERRHFVSALEWVRRIEACGLKADGRRLAQANDPTDNLLMAFEKSGAAGPAPREMPSLKVAVALLLTMFLGSAPAIAQQEPKTPAVQRRAEEQTYLTYPEWFLVFSPAEYATFVKSRPPSEFPFYGHLGQFWSSYGSVREATRKYPYNSEYHLMIQVIGVSTTIEYGMKSTYETLVGRLTEPLRPADPTAEDRFLARFAQDYVDFIRVRPWYEYDFVSELRRLWTETPAWGTGMLRKWERRYALTTELGLKAIYGWMLGKVTQASYGEAGSDTAVVVDRLPPSVGKELPAVKILEKRADGSAVLIVPRYEAFKAHVLDLARRGASISEVAGNRGPILLSVLGPSGSPLPGKILFRQPVLTDPGRERVVLTVPVPILSEVLLNLTQSGVEIEHVFDF